MKLSCCCLAILFAAGFGWAQMPDPPGQVNPGEKPAHEAYLFAHMLHGDYAIVKDERYPTLDWTTGKTIRVSRAPNLLGPYSEPGPPVSPNFREAPTLIPSPDGKAWYLYYEQYPGVAYGLSVATKLDGPWFQVAGNQQPAWDKYHLPPRVRHGSMFPITRKQYDALVAKLGKGSGSGG